MLGLAFDFGGAPRALATQKNGRDREVNVLRIGQGEVDHDLDELRQRLTASQPKFRSRS